MRDITQNYHMNIGNSSISIGRFTYGIERLKIGQWGEGAGLEIGSFCSLADSIYIFLGGNHRIDWATTYPFGHLFTEHLGEQHIKGHPTSRGDVRIGNDVWIGAGATIMSGVKIGDGAVIAANSHVVRDVRPYEIVGGNPSQSIRLRFSKDIIQLLLTLHWWDLPLEVIREISPLLSQEPTLDTLQYLILHTRQGMQSTATPN